MKIRIAIIALTIFSGSMTFARTDTLERDVLKRQLSSGEGIDLYFLADGRIRSRMFVRCDRNPQVMHDEMLRNAEAGFGWGINILRGSSFTVAMDLQANDEEGIHKLYPAARLITVSCE